MSQYIVCSISNQLFALSVFETNRIVPLESVTKIPDTPPYIMGVMESEGEVLPIVNLPRRFFDQSIADENAAQVIIVYWSGREVGLVVDEIQNITSFEDDKIDRQIEKVTSLNLDSDYTAIQSIIRSENSLILEINPENIFDLNGTKDVKQIIENYEDSLTSDEVILSE